MSTISNFEGRWVKYYFCIKETSCNDEGFVNSTEDLVEKIKAVINQYSSELDINRDWDKEIDDLLIEGDKVGYNDEGEDNPSWLTWAKKDDLSLTIKPAKFRVHWITDSGDSFSTDTSGVKTDRVTIDKPQFYIPPADDIILDKVYEALKDYDHLGLPSREAAQIESWEVPYLGGETSWSTSNNNLPVRLNCEWGRH